MVASRRVLGKGRIPASIEIVSRQVPEKGRISVSTGKRWNPCEYPKSVWASIEKGSNQREYRKMEESVSVRKNGRIRASTRKR